MGTYKRTPPKNINARLKAKTPRDTQDPRKENLEKGNHLYQPYRFNLFICFELDTAIRNVIHDQEEQIFFPDVYVFWAKQNRWFHFSKKLIF